eukprot:1153933-Pelagomonas_calceolata.AAC.13
MGTLILHCMARKSNNCIQCNVTAAGSPGHQINHSLLSLLWIPSAAGSPGHSTNYSLLVLPPSRMQV